MMNRHLKVLLAPLCALTLYGCDSGSSNSSDNEGLSEAEQSALVLDMAALDQAYIPALFYSNIGNNGMTINVPNDNIAAAARAAIDTLESEWSEFRSANETLFGTSAELDTIADYIATAKTAYAAAGQGSDVSAAHPALEAIRDDLADMREAAGIDNYMTDSITDVHHKMESVVAAYNAYMASAQDAAAQATLTNDVVGPLTDLQSAWNDCMSNMSTYLSAMSSTYGMSQAKIAYLSDETSGVMVSFSGAVSGASTALNDGDVETLVAKLGAIKPNFVKMFVAFGDFITPFRAQMIAAEKDYIPALYCTNNPADVETTCGGLNGVADKVGSFESSFNAFTANYPVLGTSLNTPAVLNWKAKLDAVTTAVDSAAGIVAASTTTAEVKSGGAHDEMEAVRNSLYDLRAEYENYDFVTDYITEYHAAFEPVVLTALDTSTMLPKQTLTQAEKDEISSAMPELQAAFSAMQDAVMTMDAEEYGVSIAELTPLLDAQEANLQDLSDALAADSEQIASLAVNVKKKFIPFFKAMGNF